MNNPLTEKNEGETMLEVKMILSPSSFMIIT